MANVGGTAGPGSDAPRLEAVVEEALKQLRNFTYRRRRLLIASTRPGSQWRWRRRSVPELIWNSVPELLCNMPRVRLENRQRNLADPAARSGAIHIFKHLKHHGYGWEPEVIREWAVVNGFAIEDARQLAEYAGGVQAGIRYHTFPDPFGRHAIIGWREAAESRK
jgi:hypothetical protein